ncbi:MAG: amidohydrolase family protein [Saprospiraceae bacterium]|nr:amidohydrolase family protein [Saprospiraceae bacterium]
MNTVDKQLSHTKTLLTNATLVLPDRIIQSDLAIESGIITEIKAKINPTGFSDSYNCEGKYILPGFIDIHNHGAVGFDFSFGQYDLKTDSFSIEETAVKDGIERALRFYAQKGVTKVLLTSMAAPLEKLEFTFAQLKSYIDQKQPLYQLIGGINLEGTFLKDPHYAGAQNPKFFYEADGAVIDRLQAASGDLLRIVNVPPEHGQKGLELIKDLHQRNIVIAGGHTAAYGDEFQAAVDAGLSLSVHFFNGPSRSSTKGFRMGGAEQIMLKSDKVSTEIICDGYHVGPAHVRDTIARKEASRVIMITDSMFANGVDGLESFSLFGLKGAVSKNREYLQMMGVQDTLFGSVLASVKGFNNVFKWLMTEMPGVWYRHHDAMSLEEALCMTSMMFSGNPARLLGMDQMKDGVPGTGRVEVGKSADLIVADVDVDLAENFVIDKVFVKGEVS